MKKFLKILGLILGVIVLAIAGIAAWVNFTGTPTYEVKNPSIQLPTDSISLARGGKIVELVCAHCHRSENGLLNGKLFSPESEGYGEIWSGNITNHPTAGLGRYKDGEIAYLLRTGIKRDGKLAGPYMLFPHLSDEDMAAVIAYLRSDAPSVQASDVVHKTRYSFMVNALIKFGIFKPLPYEGKPKFMPGPSGLVAYGRYLATARYECSTCHSASYETYTAMEPEKSPGYMGGGTLVPDVNFNYMPSRNITPDKETGIGKWTKEEFKLAIQNGIRPDKTPLTFTMPRFDVLTDEEIDAIWAYLQTVPALNTSPAVAAK
jgi:mono/diheme cytochrome c family protein